MEIKPLKRYREPGFPTRDILDEHPELLRRLPNRWGRSAVIGTALVAACGIVAARWGTAAGAAGDPVAKVAPVFVHSEGHGAFGCQVVNPPIFLSEDEARKVIQEEMTRLTPKGNMLKLESDVLVLKPFLLPETSTMGEKDLKNREDKLTLDGWDGERKIGFEYLSQSDYRAWVKKDKVTVVSSVSRYDMLTTARRLRESLVAAKPEGAFAVFYDPLVRPADTRDAREHHSDAQNQKNAEARARKELRQQVRDFVKWLQAEGII